MGSPDQLELRDVLKAKGLLLTAPASSKCTKVKLASPSVTWENDVQKLRANPFEVHFLQSSSLPEKSGSPVVDTTNP